MQARELARRLAIALYLGGLLLFVCTPLAHAGWSQAGAGQGATGGITLPAGDLYGTNSSGTNPTISNLTGSSSVVTVTSGTALAFQSTSGTASAGTIRIPYAGSIQFADTNATGNLTAYSTYGTNGVQVGDSVNTAGLNLVTASGVVNVSPSNLTILIASGTTIQVSNGANLGIGTSAFGGGAAVLGVANASTLPASNPSGGVVVYSDNGGGGFSELTSRSSAGVVDELAATGVGSVNSQTQRLRTREAVVRTTSGTGVTITQTDVSVATNTCEQYVLSWLGRNSSSPGGGTSNVTTCVCCNSTGTTTCTAGTNAYASNVTLGTSPCTTGAATVACTVASGHPAWTVTCPGGGSAVDWQISLQGNVN